MIPSFITSNSETKVINYLKALVMLDSFLKKKKCLQLDAMSCHFEDPKTSESPSCNKN